MRDVSTIMLPGSTMRAAYAKSGEDLCRALSPAFYALEWRHSLSLSLMSLHVCQNRQGTVFARMHALTFHIPFTTLLATTLLVPYTTTSIRRHTWYGRVLTPGILCMVAEAGGRGAWSPGRARACQRQRAR